jgi:hypothetical protein
MVGGVTLPIAAIGASIGLLFAGIVQMAEGRFRLLALHIPPGVALFGSSILLSIYACLCRPTQSTDAGRTADHSQSTSLPLVSVAMLDAAFTKTGIHKENR